MFGWLGYGQNQETKKDEIEVNKDAEKTDEGDNTEKLRGKEGSEVQEKQQQQKNDDSKQEQNESFQPDMEYAKDVAKNVGSFLFNIASAATSTAFKVKDTVEKKTIIGDFLKEQERFVKEKNKRSEAAVPPWVGYNEEESMKTQIMALSTDERNFLRDPPSGVPFHYENDMMFPVAMATLAEDDKLQQMRFNLVPKKVPEERFWRNYFYRVSLIKQSTQLTSLASGSAPVTPAETTEGKADTDTKQSIPTRTEDKIDHMDDLPDSPTQHEFISDDFVHQDITHHELSHEDLQQIGVDRKKASTETDSTTIKPTPAPADPGPKLSVPTVADPTPDEDIPEWEKELQQELQDYEVVDGDDNGAWEKEIEDLLEEGS